MVSVSEFAGLYKQKKELDLLKLFVQMNEFGPGYETMEELTHVQLKSFEKLHNEQLNYTKTNWQPQIAAMMLFQDPFLPGFQSY